MINAYVLGILIAIKKNWFTSIKQNNTPTLLYSNFIILKRYMRSYVNSNGIHNTQAMEAT